ncbi:MAG: hypothetical protein H8K06_12580 [Nitrospira sp.]|uniref:Transposase n=1 Tax=Nitrospira defluvii TaxID=330214 RepID=A0ABM8RSG3_9BACT|nr:hypothetical protein [Nitrospira defluvii]MCS6327908.1 hypothetical protein [Nitrospira sp.]CAE6769008.1 conserved hypothetical protein [Nitrospira defluvii]
MKQQWQRPVRRNDRQQPGHEKEEIWLLSVREFMKLPLSRLLSTRTQIRLSRLTLPDQAA